MDLGRFLFLGGIFPYGIQRKFSAKRGDHETFQFPVCAKNSCHCEKFVPLFNLTFIIKLNFELKHKTVYVYIAVPIKPLNLRENK